MSYVAFFHHHYWYEGIGAFYLKVGEQILYGDGGNTKIPDAAYGGLVFYAFLNSFFSDGFVLLKIISLLSMTGVVYLSYHILKNIFDVKIAIIGQLIIVVTPQLDRVAIQALNDPLPIVLIFIAFYFITKKHLKLFDIVLAGIFLAFSAHFRFQAVFVFLGLGIFLLIRNNEIKLNFKYCIIFVIVFITVFSPLLIYNYSMYGTILDSDPTYYALHKYTFYTAEWKEKLEPLRSESTFAIFLVDTDMFLKNYFYNLFNHNPNILFNFNTFGSISIIPIISFVGIIPVFGGLVHILKIKINKMNLTIVVGSAIITTISILWIGDITIHFFAIVIIPFLILGIIHIKNIEKNFLALLVVDVVFFITISIVPLYLGYHLFPIWLSTIALNVIFFTKTIPKIISKIRKNKKIQSTDSHTKTIIVLITIILLINVGFSYKLVNSFLYDDFALEGISEEFLKITQKRELKNERGYDNKVVGEILSKQPGIENSYVMSTFPIDAYYAGSKWLFTDYDEGSREDPLDKFITRESWSDYEIYYSNISSFPTDRNNINSPIPDYLVFNVIEGPLSDIHIELGDPNNPKIPSNWQVLYISNSTDTVLYKINHEK